MRGAVRPGARRRTALRAIRRHLEWEQLWSLLAVRSPRLLFVLAVALLLSTACATSGPILDDAQRCARFGGVYQSDTCKSAG
jgi:hypothetical protein